MAAVDQRPHCTVSLSKYAMFLGRMVCTAVIKHSDKCLWECAWKLRLKKCQAVIFPRFTATSDQWIKDLLDTNAWVIVGWFGFQLRLRYLCTGALTSRQALDRFYRYACGQQTWKKNDTDKQFVNWKKEKERNHILLLILFLRMQMCSKSELLHSLIFG